MGKRVVKINQLKRSKSWEDVLNEFLLLKRAEGRSETTFDDYERHVYYFFNRIASISEEQASATEELLATLEEHIL